MENWQYPGRKCPAAFVNEQSLLSGVLLLSAASSPLFNSALTLTHRWAGFHPRLPPITSVETKAHQRSRPLAVKTKLKWSASTVCVLKSSSFYSLGIFKPATQGVDPRTIELGQHVYTVLLTWHDKANYDTTAPWLPISAPCLNLWGSTDEKLFELDIKVLLSNSSAVTQHFKDAKKTTIKLITIHLRPMVHWGFIIAAALFCKA